MTDRAAFSATYSDWKLVRTRKVVQIVLEVPVELADQAYAVLGGMPDPGKSVWCAVARLKEGGEATAESRTTASVVGREKSSGADETSPAPAAPGRARTMAEQAGYLCTLPAFWKFLSEEGYISGLVASSEAAAFVVRRLCDVESRADIKSGTHAATRWRQIAADFRVWEMHPELT